MKICHIITGLWTGGAETMLYKLLQEWQQDDQVDGCVISLSTPQAMTEKIQALGVPVYSLGKSSDVSKLQALWRLSRLIKELQPDLLQGWMYHGNVASLLARRALEAKPVTLWNIRQALYELHNEKLMTRLVIKLGAYLSSRVDKILYNSKESCIQHTQAGYSESNSHVIPNGFLLEEFQRNQEQRQLLRERFNIADDELLVGLVGRYHPIKGQYDFIQAAKFILAQQPKTRFLLVGRDVTTEAAGLQALVDRLGLSDRFILLEEMQSIASLYSALDVFMLSSHGEGFPNVVGEAMCCCVPCVVTDVGDSAYLVGETGRVAPAKAPEQLAEQALALLKLDEQQRAQLGQQARNRVVDYFSMAAIAGQYKTLYQELLACVD